MELFRVLGFVLALGGPVSALFSLTVAPSTTNGVVFVVAGACFIVTGLILFGLKDGG